MASTHSAPTSLASSDKMDSDAESKIISSAPTTPPDSPLAGNMFPAVNQPTPPPLPDILDPNTAANTPIRRICCVGAGYVGGPTSALIALYNPEVRVTVVDRDEKRIQAWRSRHLPIEEPGLSDVVRLPRDGGSADENGDARQPNLFFSTACVDTIAQADIVLISVNTPTKRHGIGAGRATDMTAFLAAARDVAIHARPGTIIVEKSTMEEYRPGVHFPILSNPEFLAEGTAVRNLMNPDRVIIGCARTFLGHCAAAALVNLYAAWVPRSRIVTPNTASSELSKLISNFMLAQRISSINAVAPLAEKMGAAIDEIASCVGADPRIGSHFLKAGLGFGGSCFRKDVASLCYLSASQGFLEEAEFFEQTLVINDLQRKRFAKYVISTLDDTLQGKKITVLGFAFKKDTGDTRESPALDVIKMLLENGPKGVAIFDPVCSEVSIKRELSVLDGASAVTKPEGPVEIFTCPYEACADSDAILILTDWDMFKNSADAASLVNAQQQRSAAKESSLPPALAARLLPETLCTPGCEECVYTAAVSQSEVKDIDTPLDWKKIATMVHDPKWVIDGRGVLSLDAMTAMGFRLRSIGRPNPSDWQDALM